MQTRLIAILVAVLLIGGTLGVQQMRISHYQQKVAKRDTLITELTLANQKYATLTGKQNHMIIDLMDRQEKKSKEAEAEIAAAKAKAAEYARAADAILKQPVSGDECKEARRLFLNYIGGRRG